jgi:hypothetical protein
MGSIGTDAAGVGPFYLPIPPPGVGPFCAPITNSLVKQLKEVIHLLWLEVRAILVRATEVV